MLLVNLRIRDKSCSMIFKLRSFEMACDLFRASSMTPVENASGLKMRAFPTCKREFRV